MANGHDKPSLQTVMANCHYSKLARRFPTDRSPPGGNRMESTAELRPCQELGRGWANHRTLSDRREIVAGTGCRRAGSTPPLARATLPQTGLENPVFLILCPKLAFPIYLATPGTPKRVIPFRVTPFLEARTKAPIHGIPGSPSLRR